MLVEYIIIGTALDDGTVVCLDGRYKDAKTRDSILKYTKYVNRFLLNLHFFGMNLHNKVSFAAILTNAYI